MECELWDEKNKTYFYLYIKYTQKITEQAQ